MFTQRKYKYVHGMPTACNAIAAGVHGQRSHRIASDKQQMANLVDGLNIKSTGSHKVLHHGQPTLLGGPVQRCVSIIIRIKEVVLHLGGKVLSNYQMATNSTFIKGIESSLH